MAKQISSGFEMKIEGTLCSMGSEYSVPFLSQEA
jgi:hypothetical protein